MNVVVFVQEIMQFKQSNQGLCRKMSDSDHTDILNYPCYSLLTPVCPYRYYGVTSWGEKIQTGKFMKIDNKYEENSIFHFHKWKRYGKFQIAVHNLVYSGIFLLNP